MSVLNAPKVSVLMCVYNDEKFVGTAIDSILCQSFTDFEFIIVNDGSTDGTGNVLAGYETQDQRIRVFTQSNAGTTAAANFGLSVARGDYVARLDSDDLSYPDRLKIEVDYLDANPNIALVGGGSDIIDVDGNVIGARNIRTDNPACTLIHRCIYQQSDVMFRHSVVVKLGGYREKFRNAQDYDLWLRISEIDGIAKLNVPLGQWRLNGGGYTLSRAAEQREEVETIKSFARQRRTSGRDGYEDYIPAAPPKHRRSISAAEYDMLVGSVLLQAVRPLEAREKICSFLKEKTNLHAISLYLLTFIPLFAISGLFSARNFYLNRIR